MLCLPLPHGASSTRGPVPRPTTKSISAMVCEGWTAPRQKLFARSVKKVVYHVKVMLLVIATKGCEVSPGTAEAPGVSGAAHGIGLVSCVSEGLTEPRRRQNENWFYGETDRGVEKRIMLPDGSRNAQSRTP